MSATAVPAPAPHPTALPLLTRRAALLGAGGLLVLPARGRDAKPPPAAPTVWPQALAKGRVISAS